MYDKERQGGTAEREYRIRTVCKVSFRTLKEKEARLNLLQKSQIVRGKVQDGRGGSSRSFGTGFLGPYTYSFLLQEKTPSKCDNDERIFLILYYLQDLIVIKSNHIDFDNEDDQLILSDEYLNTFEQFVKKDDFDSLIKSPSSNSGSDSNLELAIALDNSNLSGSLYKMAPMKLL